MTSCFSGPGYASKPPSDTAPRIFRTARSVGQLTSHHFPSAVWSRLVRQRAGHKYSSSGPTFEIAFGQKLSGGIKDRNAGIPSSEARARVD